MSLSPFKTLHKTKISLRNKILLPFFVILILLGSGATIVSVLLIDEAISKTADERLAAFQEVVFREIKKQEIILGTYAALLQNVQALPEKHEKSTLLKDQLYTTLRESNISATFYPAQLSNEIPYESLRSLFSQVYRSGKPRFRLTTDTGSTPALTVAAPVRLNGKIQSIILLQTPVTRPFLKQLADPFNASFFILSSTGDVLIGSDDKNHNHELSPQELQDILEGRRVFKNDTAPSPRRHLFSAIPLGTTDLIILSLELPMADLSYLVKTLASGSVLAITLALLLGGYIYYHIIRQIMAPIGGILKATDAVREGNLDYQIEVISNDELGNMSESFNSMMNQLQILCSERVNHEKQLAVAQEELKYKGILEEKNRQIEKANKELKSHFKEISALFQLNQAMTSTLDLNILFDRMFEVMKDLLHSNAMVLLIYNLSTCELEPKKADGIDLDALKDVTFSLDEGITGTVARSKELIYIPDISCDERNLHYKGNAYTSGSMVSAPLIFKERLAGVLNLHKERTHSFTDTEIRLIQAVANQAAVAIENAQLYEKTRNLSNTDELTSLANRRHFQEILKRETAHAKRYNSPFCLIMIDIDHFKRFNDTHGHLMGDIVLKKVSSIFLQNTRGIDLVSRFGGEEFVILLPKTDKKGAVAAAEKLRRRVYEEPFDGEAISQPDGVLTISLGVSEFPTDSNDIYELLDFADRALYLAKEKGRNCTIAWNPGKHHEPDIIAEPAL